MRINLFGTFRKYGNGEFIEITIGDGFVISDIRNLFIKQIIELEPNFNEQDIVGSSVFAINDKIVNDDHFIKDADTLAILPPVCGGWYLWVRSIKKFIKIAEYNLY